MRHAILGAGGVGSFVGGSLARAGADVLLLLRPETLARHLGRLRVESVLLGDFEVDVATASALDREVDVLWVTPKTTQLEAALELAPSERVGDAVAVPLLNGVDHVAVLHERYGHVLAAAISVESERIDPGLVRQKTPADASLGEARLPRAARVDDDGAFLGFSGGELRTSMQKDFDAGRPLELDAIGGPIVRGGRRHGIATPTTEETRPARRGATRCICPVTRRAPALSELWLGGPSARAWQRTYFVPAATTSSQGPTNPSGPSNRPSSRSISSQASSRPASSRPASI